MQPLIIEIVILYVCVAAVSAIVCAFVRRQWAVDILLANLMLGFVGAWLGALLFGAIGPAIAGVPILACFGLALPMQFGFNAIFAPIEQRFYDNVVHIRPRELSDIAA